MIDSIFPSIIGFIGVIIGVAIAYFTNRNREIINTITKARLDEYYDMRSILNDFATECLCPSGESNKKELLISKTIFYFRSKDALNVKLHELMVNCSTDFNSVEEERLAFTKFIEASQELLAYKWVRIKQEAGINIRKEESRRKTVIETV